MELLNKLLALSITAGSALLLLDLLKKQYPQQWAMLRDQSLTSLDFVKRLRAYMDSPPWQQEMAEVRGLRPGDKATPL